LTFHFGFSDSGSGPAGSCARCATIFVVRGIDELEICIPTPFV